MPRRYYLKLNGHSGTFGPAAVWRAVRVLADDGHHVELSFHSKLVFAYVDGVCGAGVDGGNFPSPFRALTRAVEKAGLGHLVDDRGRRVNVNKINN